MQLHGLVALFLLIHRGGEEVFGGGSAECVKPDLVIRSRIIWAKSGHTTSFCDQRSRLSLLNLVKLIFL